MAAMSRLRWAAPRESAGLADGSAGRVRGLAGRFAGSAGDAEVSAARARGGAGRVRGRIGREDGSIGATAGPSRGMGQATTRARRPIMRARQAITVGLHVVRGEARSARRPCRRACLPCLRDQMQGLPATLLRGGQELHQLEASAKSMAPPSLAALHHDGSAPSVGFLPSRPLPQTPNSPSHTFLSPWEVRRRVSGQRAGVDGGLRSDGLEHGEELVCVGDGEVPRLPPPSAAVSVTTTPVVPASCWPTSMAGGAGEGGEKDGERGG
jgi:hypothetical protein